MFGSAVVSQTIVAAAAFDCRAFAGDGALLLWKMMFNETAFCLGWVCLLLFFDSYQVCLCVSAKEINKISIK